MGINVLSLFDGMSVGRIALEKANIKVANYFSSEIKEHAIQVANQNYPQDEPNRLGDVTKIQAEDLPRIDLLIGGSPCFIAGTLVQTDKGLVPIEDIQVGDNVVTHKSRYQKVLKTGGTTTDTLYKIKALGVPELYTTAEHPFYVKESKLVWENNKRTYVRQFSEPLWVPACELTKDHYVSTTYVPVVGQPTGLLNERFWEFVGRFTADGWLVKTKRKNRKGSYMYKVMLCCSYDEEHYCEKLVQDMNYNYCKVHERTVVKFCISQQELLEFLEPIGRGASNKQVHPELLKYPKYIKEAYLKGYIDGDGCTVNGTTTYATISSKLAYSIKLLMTEVYGRGIKLYKHTPPKTKYIEGRHINQAPQYKGVMVLEPTKAQTHLEGCVAWAPLKEIEEVPQEVSVYNLEVENDNSYTANSLVVHNCQDFSRANAERLGTEGIKSSLFYEYLRLLKDVQPSYFLLENVVMKAEHEKELTEYLGVEPIRINSKDVAPAMRDRLYWTNIPNVRGILTNNVKLNDVLHNGYADRDKARALLQSDSRPLNTPIKMAHRYFNTGFTTLIFKDKEHYEIVKAHFDEHFKGKSAKEIEQMVNDGVDVSIYDGLRYMTGEEREACQTIPRGYTQGLTENQRACLLGDGWTANVIAHILKYLPEEFKDKE